MIFKSMRVTSGFESSAPDIAPLTHLNQRGHHGGKVPSILNGNELGQIFLEILSAQLVGIKFVATSGTCRERIFSDVSLRERSEIANAHF
jgi:hypothetical protein